jgi:DNA-binding response OmpR family regulator
VKEDNGMEPNNPKAKILLIDDDPDFRKVVSIMLKSGPYDVITAENPQEGKEKLLSEKPDLILLDIMMDTLFDGFSLCNDIKTSKEYEKFSGTPVIFVSAVKERAGSRFTFDPSEQGLVGPDDYIDKPVQAEDLFARIDKLLKK